MALADKIRAARLAKGLKQKEIADHFGIKPEAVSQWEKKDGTGPKRDRLAALAKLLGKPMSFFGEELEPEPGPNDSLSSAVQLLQGETQNEATQQGAPELPILTGLPRDLPVLGSAQGGNGIGDFELNGQVVDWIRRPPALSDVKSAFAVAVIGESMSPRFDDGEVVFIHPGRRYSRGRDVLIELHSENGIDPAGPALIKRFVVESTDRVTVEQLNPPKKINIPRARIKRISLILRPDELFRQ